MTASKFSSGSNLFTDCFVSLKDPRRTTKGHILYPINEILFLTISAVVSGLSSWTGIALFGEEKIEWLRSYFPYSNGSPSHDVLGNFFSLLDPAAFEACFARWVSSIGSVGEGDIVCFDGKTIRGASRMEGRKYPIHVVSAYAANQRLCLGPLAVDQKSNEITAIPKLLDQLAIQGCIVTIDAMGCQKEIAHKIASKGADYILMVKNNQQELKEQVEKVLNRGNAAHSATDTDFGHGRIETRKCTVTQDVTFLDGKEEWSKMRSVIKVESERIIKKAGEISAETRYYISTLQADPKRLNASIRSHWAIENNLHWSLDVIFGEDDQLKRKGYSAQNFNIINKVALGLLEQEKTCKGSKPNKRIKAALSDAYRVTVLKC